MRCCLFLNDADGGKRVMYLIHGMGLDATETDERLMGLKNFQCQSSRHSKYLHRRMYSISLSTSETPVVMAPNDPPKAVSPIQQSLFVTLVCQPCGILTHYQ